VARLEHMLADTDRLRNIGISLFQTYRNKEEELSRGRSLPQLSFSIREIIRSGCLITSQNGRYVFLFPFEYSPKDIFDNGTRHQISGGMVERISRKALLEITTEGRGNAIYAPRVLNGSGAKLEHYHGSTSSDCWGSIPLPNRWDGTFLAIHSLARELIGSLSTINYNSVMRRHPFDMPNADIVLASATRLGVEGVTEEPAPQEEALRGEAPTERRWGRR